MAKEASVALKGLRNKFKRSFKKYRDQDVKPKTGGGLPKDLRRETCQPSKYSISVSEQGDEYVSLTCIAVTPEEYNGVPATKFWYFNESDTKTSDDRLEIFVNDLKLMGCDISEIEELFAPGVLEAVLDELIERKPYLLYHTYSYFNKKTKQEGRVQFEIDGINDKFEATEEEPQVEEGEPEEEEVEDTTPTRSRSTKNSGTTRRGSASKNSEPEEEEEEEVEEEAEAEEEEAPADDMPEVGQTYGYKQSPKGVVEACKVIKINPKDRTCTLKRVRDKKVFDGVDVDTDLHHLSDDDE